MILAEQVARVEEMIKTPQAFRAWLEGKGTFAYVGERGDCESCPLASFLSEQVVTACVVLPARIEFSPRVSGGSDALDGSAGQVSVAVPAWVASFIDRVDEADGEGSEVCADEALALLQEVVA